MKHSPTGRERGSGAGRSRWAAALAAAALGACALAVVALWFTPSPQGAPNDTAQTAATPALRPLGGRPNVPRPLALPPDLDPFDREPGAPEGADAPEPAHPPDLLPVDETAAQAEPGARAALHLQANAWLDDLGQAARAHDWNAVRTATEMVRRNAAALSARFTDALMRDPDPERALAAGLVLEELLEDGTLDEDARSALGRAVVTPLARDKARQLGVKLEREKP